jgi:hypothetical protein
VRLSEARDMRGSLARGAPWSALAGDLRSRRPATPPVKTLPQPVRGRCKRVGELPLGQDRHLALLRCPVH